MANPVAEKLSEALDAAEYGQWERVKKDALDAVKMARRRIKLEEGKKDEAGHSCSDIEPRYVKEEGERLGTKCDKPPPGWRCTRTLGHDGPCAALPHAQEQVGEGND